MVEPALLSSDTITVEPLWSQPAMSLPFVVVRADESIIPREGENVNTGWGG